MDRHDLAGRGENDGLWDWNLDTGRIHFSARWNSMLGYEEHEIGNTAEEWFERIHPEDLDEIRSEIERHLAENSTQFENQHRMRHRDGTYRWLHCRGTITRDASGRATRISGAHADITGEKIVDPLTGLPNRLLLLDRLTRSVERARRNRDFLFAALILDLDRSESLNARSGCAGRDLLVITAARRLETCLRAGDTVARLCRDHVVARAGGDEFIVLLDGLNEVGDAKTVADRLLGVVSAPFELDGREVFLSASIGIALSATGYESAEGVLRDADIALYRAKSLGKARCEVFDTALLESAQSTLQLESDLDEALERGEFSVFYQPIVALTSGRIVAFEALVRWNHPSRGLISPQDFIPISERTGLIVPLGRWVLREACRQLKAWQEEPDLPNDLRISVNISSVQLRQSTLVEEIHEVLEDVHLEPHCLMLELTEGMIMENPGAGSLLMQLRVMGVQIGLDDFGTGYSSLTYLRRFPLDFLKVDHSFVRSLETNPDNLEIVRTITSLAHQLGLRVIAEGIENKAHLQLIRSLHCEFGQGFLYSRPVDAKTAEALLIEEPLQWSIPSNGAGEGKDGEARAAPGKEKILQVPVHSLGHEGPAPEQTKGWLTQRSGAIVIALAALLLISAGGWIARLNRLTSPPVAYSAPPGSVGTPQAPGKLPTAEPAVEPKVSSKPEKPADSIRAPKPIDPAPEPAKKEPVEYSYPVIHDHLIGSCKGILHITGDTLSFISEKGKDSFTLNHQEFSYDLSADQLTVKSGSKTYHFKSANAAGSDENRAQLRDIFQNISRFHSQVAGKEP